MKIGFDHCYQRTKNAEEYFALGDRGFSTSDYMVEHPGKKMCRFLIFKTKTPGASGRKSQYLEFSEVFSPQELRALFNNNISDRQMYEPGFSLNCDTNLNLLFAESQKSHSDYSPIYSHKNYDWKYDDSSSLPGWNFLKFEKNIIHDIFVWCTEYEPRPDLKVPEIADHPNTVSHFLGFVWNYKPTELNAFLDLTKTKITAGKIELVDNSVIYLPDSPEFPLAALGPKKNYPFSAVIMACKNWETFKNLARPDSVFTWKGKNAGVIKTGENGWDIIVVEE